MIEPKYQDIGADSLPVVRVKVLSGEYQGTKSTAENHTPVDYFDVYLMPDAVFEQPVPEDRNAFIYVIDGKAKTGTAEEPTYVKAEHLAVYGPGDSIKVQVDGDKPLHLLFASGQKINEPVVRGGPFVMNTMGELKQAFYDYQTGSLGK